MAHRHIDELRRDAVFNALTSGLLRKQYLNWPWVFQRLLSGYRNPNPRTRPLPLI